jgi:hypothetical protein
MLVVECNTKKKTGFTVKEKIRECGRKRQRRGSLKDRKAYEIGCLTGRSGENGGKYQNLHATISNKRSVLWKKKNILS